MALFELVNKSGDTGMLVVGAGVDATFRKQADEADRPDERLLDTSAREALDPSLIHVAAIGACGQIAVREVRKHESA